MTDVAAVQRVAIDISDHVAVVTLTRPEKHNALDRAMFEAIAGAASRVAAEPGVRAVVHEPYEPEDAARFVAQKLGVPFVLLATSVGSVPEAKDYFALFNHNVATLAKALGVPSQ